MPNGVADGANPAWGAHFSPATGEVHFQVFSCHATRIEVWLYAQPKDAEEIARRELVPGPNGVFAGALPLAQAVADTMTTAVFYGFRAWGPNWPYDPAWQKGTEKGFLADVDDEGNRFNPNKLLFDPRAREISHDPAPRLSNIDPNEYADAYYSGPQFRAIDTGRMAPKSVLPLTPPPPAPPPKPRRSLKDDIIYEVHVRGFTRQDPTVPAEYRGTYRGAALKAPHLKSLGVTAVEFLPVFQFASEQNDDGDPRGDNYWGYMTLGFFAPNRRYAADQSPGGPTREFRAMVRAFHEAGLKVFLDVVFNHTGEGLLRRRTETDDSRQADDQQLADCACLLCWRGLDNATYYALRSNLGLDGGHPNHRYQDNSACGGNLNTAHPEVQHFILDVLRYWSEEQGVDGFRFDLAPVIGNSLAAGGFHFDAQTFSSLPQRITRELPARSATAPDGVDLIAEPWAVGDGAYQLGQFPDGWAEWNDVYRKTLRLAANKLHVIPLAPWQMANVLSGSAQQFAEGTPRAHPSPATSINYLASHDGLTLRDLFAYTNNEDAWDQGGDPAAQRQAVRNAFALLMTSAGVPMFMGGDEFLRSQGGCANAVALDNPVSYLRWTDAALLACAEVDQDQQATENLRQRQTLRLFRFARSMIGFRQRFSALRPEAYFTGTDRFHTGLKDLSWHGRDGNEFTGGWSDTETHFLGFRVDTAPDRAGTGTRSLYVAYNWDDGGVGIQLPPNLPGARWLRRVDTAAWMEPEDNLDPAGTWIPGSYGLHGRSLAIFVEH